jgi:hypothetical protein
MAMKLLALHAARPLHPGRFLVRFEELGKLKNPMISLGIEL